MSRRARVTSLIAVILVAAMGLGTYTVLHPFSTQANPAAHAKPDGAHKSDERTTPLTTKQHALRQEALQAKLEGKASGKVLQVAKGQYVELEREGEDSIWTVVGEFGTQIHPSYGGTPGPVHNQIPQPDRSVDNTTIWQPDFTQAYYENLLFSEAPGAVSMRNFYIEQSSGRYAVNGDVTNWVKVPYNEARYGADYCGDIVCPTTWLFVRDSLTAWYDGQIAAGKTPAEIDAYLAQFDTWDRYDYDGDGNFNEPDGYIDHFQSIHAGEGEETGGGAQGDDAIWSHRWYVQLTPIGGGGPTVDGQTVPFGGVRVGNSKYWVGDYTIEPENGGVGVFSHEFAHDLGLPDEYDTAGNTGNAENSTGWWTLMSQGSYGTDNGQDLGTKPIHMSAWDKFQLGWLDNYQVVYAGQKAEFKLGPAETNTKRAQALFVVLPDKQVTKNIGAPYAGGKYYYSGSGNNLDNFMYKQVSLPASGASLTAKVNYNIEPDWDYAYVVVSTDNGATWTGVSTNRSTNTNPNGQNKGNGITGASGGWVDLTADLSAYAGQTVLVGFRYWTDVAATYPGFSADEISIAGGPADGAETDGGWTFKPASGGFHATTGTETQSFFNAYVAEYRQYRGFDSSLQKGPYNFGFLNDPTRQNWVEHFPYQDGLLIWYWDTSQADDNTGSHPGEGLILPIDAHPAPLLRPDNNQPWRPRVQSYDSPFSLEPTDSITLHVNSTYVRTYPSLPGVPVFDDRNDYWNPALPAASVKVPHTGTIIQVVSVSAQGSFMQVRVSSAG